MSGAASPAKPHFVKLVFHYAISGGVPLRSLGIALVVGSILNLINQGDRLFAGRPLDFVKLALTYCVPYFVSTYGAVSFRIYADKRQDAQLDPQGGPT